MFCKALLLAVYCRLNFPSAEIGACLLAMLARSYALAAPSSAAHSPR